MKAVVIGMARSKEFSRVTSDLNHPDLGHFWIAGIFGEKEEADSFQEQVEGRAIAVHQRSAQVRGQQRYHYHPSNPESIDNLNEAEDIHEATCRTLRQLDPKLPPQIDDATMGWQISYLVREGEIRGFWVD